MQDGKPNETHAKVRGRRRRIFTGGVAVVGSAGLAAALMLPSGSALAAYQQTGPSPDGSSIASVVVGSAISLTDNTPTFQLGTTGSTLPGDTLTADPVTLTVYTNNVSGYNVTVQAATDMTASGTTDIIPATDLSVEDLATTDTKNTATDKNAYVPITAATSVGPPAPLIVYDQITRSAIGTVDPTTGAITGGDTLHESWKLNTPVPDVNTGTYTATLNFIATANT